MPVVQSIVGHGSPAITRHYVHIGESAARQAINALPMNGSTYSISTKADIINLLSKANDAQLEKILLLAADVLSQA